jgi:manganese-dependent inorganic pyrophosphatase
MIGAMGLDSFAQRLERYPREKLAVVVGDRWDIQNLAIREGVQVLIVTGGHGVEKKTVEAARKNKVNLISSPHDTATTAALCRASIAIRHVVDEDFLAVNEDAALEEVRARATASGFAAFPVLDAQGRTAGVLSKTDFLKPMERKLILVDHNELSQAVQGAGRRTGRDSRDHRSSSHRHADDAAADPLS